MRIKILGALIILGFGATKLSFEHELMAEHRAAYFHSANLDLDLRQQLGQMGFLAALSGFRAAVADILWIEANSAWERTEWARMKLLMDTVTALQPRALTFWDNAAWHMAWNASVAAMEDPKQPRATLRLKAQLECFKLGEDYLLRGIQNNPDRPLLYQQLGLLYREKFKDHARAAEQYEKALRFPDAPPYIKRFAAYELAKVPGREQEAYDRLLALYRLGEKEHLITLLNLISDLEEKLNVPSERKIAMPKEPHP